MKRINSEMLREEARYLRLCCYGEPGSGKTWFGASACLDEATSPVLYIEYKAQIASLASNPEYTQGIEDGSLVIVRLEKYKELDHVYTWMFTGNFPEELFKEPPKTIVVDSITELQRAEVMRKAGNPIGKFLVDIEAPQIAHWGTLLNQFTLLGNKYYDPELPYHIVFLGLEAVDYGHRTIGEAPSITGYRLAMQGQAQRQFPAYALTVMRMERAPRNSQAYAVGYTQAVKSKTKEQTGCFPPKIVGPTIPIMVKMLEDGRDDT